MAPLPARLALTALACLAIGVSVSPATAATDRAGDPCAVMGTAEVAGVTVPACRRFHGTGAAVRLSADTPEATYGVWDGRRLLTRSGAVAAQGAEWESLATPGLYLRARVLGRVATDPEPALFVSQSAVLRPLVGLQAVARIEWIDPPTGVKDARVILRFPAADVATVATYRRSIAVKGTCIADLTATPAAKRAYAPFLGDGRLELLWMGGMHMPVDSQIVLDSPNGPSWMTRGPALIDLLKGPWRPARVDFSIHAAPIGTPASIAGSLTQEIGRPC